MRGLKFKTNYPQTNLVIEEYKDKEEVGVKTGE